MTKLLVHLSVKSFFPVKFKWFFFNGKRPVADILQEVYFL